MVPCRNAISFIWMREYLSRKAYKIYCLITKNEIFSKRINAKKRAPAESKTAGALFCCYGKHDLHRPDCLCFGYRDDSPVPGQYLPAKQ